jgi:hypothetical protein
LSTSFAVDGDQVQPIRGHLNLDVLSGPAVATGEEQGAFRPASDSRYVAVTASVRTGVGVVDGGERLDEFGTEHGANGGVHDDPSSARK